MEYYRSINLLNYYYYWIIKFFDYESKLWKRLMHNRFYRRIHDHIFYLYFYDNYIRQNYYQNNDSTANIFDKNNYLTDELYIDYDQIDYNSDRPVPRSFWNIILPGLMSTIQTIGAGLYVIRPDYFQKFAFIGTFARFNPPEGREYFLTAWAIAAFSVIIMMFYCITTKVKNYQFLRILYLNQNDYHQHYLTNNEFKQFEQSRDRILSAVRSFIVIVVLVFPFGFIPTIIQLEAYKISMFWTIFWFIIINTNIWYLFMTQYYFPIFIVMLQYYFRIRQRNLYKRLIRLNNRLLNQENLSTNRYIWIRQINNEFLRINRLYGLLRQEIYSNSNQLRRFVTTIFIDLSMQSTYLISIVLFTKIGPAITVVIMQITTGITTMLIIFLYSCSMIEYEDRKFFIQKQKCLNLGNINRNIFTTKNSIKLGTPFERSFGFTLIHDIVISSSLSVNVFINISTFFFLIAPQIR